MGMTEDEAKTKWCPLVRVLDSRGPWNRHPDKKVSSDATCLGSACMMWRWEGWPAGRTFSDDRPPIPKTGDCGLKRGD